MKKRRSFRQILTDALELIWKDINSAKWAVAVIIAYFVILKRFFYSMCPLVVFTGFPCPGCGLTRAGMAVLSFDFAGAFQMHPFIYPLMGLFLMFLVNRYLLRKKKMPVLRVCLTVTLAAMIVFYAWRMYRYFPGEPPMSYYGGNWLKKLFEKAQSLR